jgi:hypothetical protein
MDSDKLDLNNEMIAGVWFQLNFELKSTPCLSHFCASAVFSQHPGRNLDRSNRVGLISMCFAVSGLRSSVPVSPYSRGRPWPLSVILYIGIELEARYDAGYMCCCPVWS